MENSQENNTKKDGSVGPTIGSVIVILIIIIGGFYFWNSIINKNVTEDVNEQTQGDEQTMQLEAQSDSTEINDIEKDLMDTNLDNLEEGIDQI